MGALRTARPGLAGNSHGRPGHAERQAADLAGCDRGGPRHVFFGWKNFYVKDHPMLSPRLTMAKIPRPMMISYQ
jgi:hypothetical protein